MKAAFYYDKKDNFPNTVKGIKFSICSTNIEDNEEPRIIDDCELVHVEENLPVDMRVFEVMGTRHANTDGLISVNPEKVDRLRHNW